METLPDDIKMLINEYSSDRVGVHPTARLIKNLTFRHSLPHEFHNDGYESTVVETHVYFIKRPNIWVPLQPNILRFCHNQFDERNFPEYFDISLRCWENMLEQDEIERLGELGSRRSLSPTQPHLFS